MTKQTQGSMTLVGAISGGIFLVAFVALMIVGDYTFSPALFLAAVVAAAAAVFLFVAFHRKPAPQMGASAHRQADPAPARASAPAAAPEPAPTPAPQPAPAPVAQAEPAPAPVPTPAPVREAPAAAPVAESKPATLSAPLTGGPDDLKKIKGVGPKLEAMLHGMGFYHFDQIANWTSAEVAWVDDNLEGFKGRVSRDGWVDQARLLAAGGETEFSKRVDGGDVY